MSHSLFLWEELYQTVLLCVCVRACACEREGERRGREREKVRRNRSHIISLIKFNYRVSVSDPEFFPPSYPSVIVGISWIHGCDFCIMAIITIVFNSDIDFN